MKNTLWITLLSAVSMFTPVASAMSYDEEEDIPPAPAPAPERPKHPARVVKSEVKKDAAEIPADLQELVARVQALDEAAFDELVRCCGEKQDWPSSVLLRCLTIAAGTGHAPSQVELVKRGILSGNRDVAFFWLAEIFHSLQSAPLRDLSAWMRQQGYQNAAYELEERLAGYTEGRRYLNPVIDIESEFGKGTFPSLAPGSEAACLLERGEGMKSVPKTTAPAPEPQPVARPSQGSVSPQALQNLVPLYDRLARLRCREAYSAFCQKRLLMLLGLIRNGANINVATVETEGSNALHYACALGSLSITKWLLENGADPNARTDKGVVPLSCVGSDNREAIIQLLKQYGAGQN